MTAPFRLLKRRTPYKGRIVQVNVDRVREPGGVTADCEVVCHGGSVVVVAELDDGRVLLVRQFRYPTGRRLWELVAGGIERGETPTRAARRELLEETGYRARHFRRLFDFYPSPGFLTERMFLVEARGLVPAKARPEADERIEVRRFTRRELRALLRGRKIRDAKTLVGLFWFFHSRHERI